MDVSKALHTADRHLQRTTAVAISRRVHVDFTLISRSKIILEIRAVIRPESLLEKANKQTWCSGSKEKAKFISG